MRPRFVRILRPPKDEGAGKTGCRPAPMAPVLNIAQAMHRGKTTGEAGNNPVFPARWFDGLWRALLGDEFPLASVASRTLAMHRCPVGSMHLPRKLDTSNGCRDHTLLPYATTSFVLRAALRSRGSAQSSARPAPHVPRRRRSRPPHPKPAFRDDARSAPRAGWDGCTISTFPTSEKANYFYRQGLTNLWRDLPVRPHTPSTHRAGSPEPDLESAVGRGDAADPRTGKPPWRERRSGTLSERM
jgi:hypothetical protein